MRGWRLLHPHLSPHILVKILLDVFPSNIHYNFPGYSTNNFTSTNWSNSGILFRGIKRFATNASRVSPTSLSDVFKFLVQIDLVKLANDFQRSKEEDPNDLETKIRRQFSLSNPDWPQTPFVFNAPLI